MQNPFYCHNPTGEVFGQYPKVNAVPAVGKFGETAVMQMPGNACWWVLDGKLWWGGILNLAFVAPAKAGSEVALPHRGKAAGSLTPAVGCQIGSGAALDAHWPGA